MSYKYDGMSDEDQRLLTPAFKRMKPWIDPRDPAFDDEAEAIQNEDRLDREVAATVENMRQVWPDAADWHVESDENVQILDKKDTIIAVITSAELDRLYVDDDQID